MFGILGYADNDLVSIHPSFRGIFNRLAERRAPFCIYDPIQNHGDHIGFDSDHRNFHLGR